MADLDETLAGPADVAMDAPIPEALADEGVEIAIDALEASEPDDHLTDEGPGTSDEGAPLESSESETTDASEDEDRPITRRELARQNDALRQDLKSLLEDRDRAQREAVQAAEALERSRKTEAELEQDFFALIGTDEEYAQADHASRYSDDPYEREQALETFDRLRSMREKLPKAWLWYVGKIAGADVKEFAEETKLSHEQMVAAPRMKDLLTYVRTEAVKTVESEWKSKYAALNAKLEAANAALDAAKARAGAGVPSPERGGRAATGSGALTLDTWRSWPHSKRQEFLSTPEGKAKYNALTRSLQGVA